MPVDLKSSSLFQRSSILIQPDCLIRLEHGMTKDRLRRIAFDRVERVIIWRRVAVVQIILLAVVLGLPGLLLLIPGDYWIVFGIILLLISIGGIAFYLICGVTTIRIVRAGRAEEIKGVFFPWKVRRVTQSLAINIHATQESGFAALAARQAAMAVPPENQEAVQELLPEPGDETPPAQPPEPTELP